MDPGRGTADWCWFRGEDRPIYQTGQEVEHSQEARVDQKVSTEIPGYRIESLIGRGGMGVVYLAEDLSLKRKVALKVLAPELARDEKFRERFVRESQLAASLDHPNIIPIFEAREAGSSL
jgi:serine/threonine protein kinase